ncbi:MAG TPA: hypothetical protein ENK13_00605, partial [Thermopetrobacter sp.]|nr:hypothetical protein [Thermopetrobacter sp.]
MAIRRRRARAPFFLVLGGLIALASAPAHASPVLKKVRKVGDMRIVIHYKNPEAEDAYTFTPSVELFRGEERLTGVRLKEVVTPPQVTVTEMDPGNDGPEILVSGYTGGAHCCTVIKVFTALGDGPDADWRVV